MRRACNAHGSGIHVPVVSGFFALKSAPRYERSYLLVRQNVSSATAVAHDGDPVNALVLFLVER